MNQVIRLVSETDKTLLFIQTYLKDNELPKICMHYIKTQVKSWSWNNQFSHTCRPKHAFSSTLRIKSIYTFYCNHPVNIANYIKLVNWIRLVTIIVLSILQTHIRKLGKSNEKIYIHIYTHILYVVCMCA